MPKEKHEAESLDQLIADVMPEGAKVYVKPINIANSDFPGVSVRAIDVDGGMQFQTNAFNKSGESKWFCGAVSENPLPKDPKKLAKSLREYKELTA